MGNLKRVLGIGASALLAVTGFTLLARFWWFFDLFSHFRLQYVAVAGFLCIAAMAVRAHVWAAVLFGMTLVHGFAIKDLWFGSSTEIAPAALSIRVASANVQNANPTPEKILELVVVADADVVLLLDAHSKRWHTVLAALGDRYRYGAPESWINGAPLMVLSRWPITSYRFVSSAHGRSHLTAQIEIGGRRLTVVGLRAQSPSLDKPLLRNRQLRQIARTLNSIDGPVIVAGDFNTSPWSPHFRDLLETTGSRNAAEGNGWIATWPAGFWPALVPIDRVLLKGPLAAAAIRRGPPTGSDHFPIVADIALLPEPPANTALQRVVQPFDGSGAW